MSKIVYPTLIELPDLNLKKDVCFIYNQKVCRIEKIIKYYNNEILITYISTNGRKGTFGVCDVKNITILPKEYQFVIKTDKKQTKSL